MMRLKAVVIVGRISARCRATAIKRTSRIFPKKRAESSNCLLDRVDDAVASGLELTRGASVGKSSRYLADMQA